MQMWSLSRWTFPWGLHGKTHKLSKDESHKNKQEVISNPPYTRINVQNNAGAELKTLRCSINSQRVGTKVWHDFPNIPTVVDWIQSRGLKSSCEKNLKRAQSFHLVRLTASHTPNPEDCGPTTFHSAGPTERAVSLSERPFRKGCFVWPFKKFQGKLMELQNKEPRLSLHFQLPPSFCWSTHVPMEATDLERGHKWKWSLHGGIHTVARWPSTSVCVLQESWGLNLAQK